MNDGSLERKVNELIDRQTQEWVLARTNYAGLGKVETKTFHFDGFRITAQFNPERIRSSGAKTDAESIQARACFLCADNRPAVQRGIDFSGKYTILINPYPIFPQHLTVALKEHLPQQIEPYLADMLQLSQALPGFTVFYNGPKCGASAPDHFHFQVGSKRLLPIYHDLGNIVARLGELLFQDETAAIHALGKDFLRNVLLYSSTSPVSLRHHLQLALDALKERGQEGEPMLNLLVDYEDGRWQVLLFPRDRQRPWQYFAEGTDRILMSPASVEMAGLVILPRKEDFDKLTNGDLADIYQQVTINEAEFDLLKVRIKNGFARNNQVPEREKYTNETDPYE
ncbi:MAG: DUF4922 domain-containing protein [Mangrovibacterium sp.]